MRRLAIVLLFTLGFMVACATVEEPAQVGPAPTPTSDVCPSELEQYYIDSVRVSMIVVATSKDTIEWLNGLSKEQILSLGEQWSEPYNRNFATIWALNETVLKYNVAPTERTVPLQERIATFVVGVDLAGTAFQDAMVAAETVDDFLEAARTFSAALDTAVPNSDEVDETVEAICDKPATASAAPAATATPASPTPLARPARDGLTLVTAAYADGMATAPNGVTMRIVEVIDDATTTILNHDKIFNAPPPEGFRYVMVTVEVGNTSARSLEFEADQFFLISDTRTRYDMPLILVIPNSIRGGSLVSGSTEVFPGGAATKNVAYLVPNNETGYALMFDADRREENDRAFILLPE